MQMQKCASLKHVINRWMIIENPQSYSSVKYDKFVVNTLVCGKITQKSA